MTSPTDILSLIAAGETETVEFKRTIDNPESIAGEIVAFANVNGGLLYERHRHWHPTPDYPALT